MPPDVVIVGTEAFFAPLNHLIREMSDLEIATVETIDALDEAIQQSRPGLLILQANDNGLWRWCQRFKQQPSHSWVYCLAIDQPSVAIPHYGLERNLQSLQRNSQALSIGFNAYLWLDPQPPSTALATAQAQLLEASLRTGIGHLQKYRELSHANDLLSAIALSDALTQLSNRRAFDWELPRQIQMAREQAVPLCLLILDIDHFKAVNDTYGHLIGDQVLQILAERLRHNMRFYETPFRYGGEEFVIILTDTRPHEAMQISQRLCCSVSQQPFVIGPSLQLSITVSIGLADLRSEDDAKGISLLDRADQNLLKAKNDGRNRVIQS